jgi:hypothetical protein
MGSIRLSRAAGELLLRLMDQNPPVVAQVTLDHFNAEAGRELIAAGALVAEGCARSITLFDDDEPRNVDLVWLDRQSAYGYFSAVDGFVVPDPKSLQLYRAELGWWLNWLTAALNLVNAGKPTTVISNTCWIVGDIWVTSKTKVPLIFARRMTSKSIADQIASSLKQRAVENGAIVLMTSRFSPVDLSDRFELKSIQTVLNSDGKDFAIDRAQLVARWCGYGAFRPTDPISLSADGRILNLHGHVLHLRGRVHRSIVKKLFDAYVCGEPLRTQDVLSEASSSVDTIAKAFRGSKHWEMLGPLIRTKNGLSCFEI